MNDRKEDQLLEDYLKGGSDLSRHYRGESEEKPPAHLDALILRTAQFAARKYRKPITPLWYLPLSLAAVLVIGVSVLIKMYDQQGERVLPASQIEQSFESTSAAKSVPPVAADQPALVASPESPLQQAQPSAGENAPDQLSTRSRLEEIVVRSAPAPVAPQNTAAQENMLRMEATEINAQKMETRMREETRSRESAAQNARMEYAPAADITTSVKDEPTTDTIRKARADNRASAAPPTASTSATNHVEQGAVLEEITVTGGIAADTRLAQVKQLWLADRKDDAVESFKEFLADYPGYPRAAIIKQLPADFDVDKYLRKNSNAE